MVDSGIVRFFSRYTARPGLASKHLCLTCLPLQYLADLLGVASELVRSVEIPGVYWNIVRIATERCT
jgi:hypothetical protein